MSELREAARQFATNGPTALLPSASSLAHNTNGRQNYRAIFSLVSLIGNYDAADGQRSFPSSFAHMAVLFPTREREFMQSRPYSEMADQVGSDRFPVWMEVIDEEGQDVHLPEHLRSGKPYALKALIGFGLNHRMWPDSQGGADTLDKLEFFVIVHLLMTDSCKFADIVLPACSSLERNKLRRCPMGLFHFHPACH